MALPLLVLTLGLCGQEPSPVRVDARVELLTLVFRLIGAEEFDQPRSRSPYSEEVELWFGDAREHEACARARALRREHGIGFNAVPDLAVHLTDPPELALRVPLEPWPERLDARWKGADVEGFLAALRSFVEDTGFLEFQESFEATRLAAEASLARQVEASRALPWLHAFFGPGAEQQAAETPSTTFTAVPGLLCGPANFGCSVRLENGALELWPVIGASTWDAEGHPVYSAGDLPTVVHEFTHAFANPFVDRHWDVLGPGFERVFPSVHEVMARQAYGNPRTVAYESLVRACVVRHAADERGAEAALQQARYEEGRGFAWTGALAELLGRYEAERARYPDLDAFAHELGGFFEAWKAPAPATGEPAGGR